MELKSQLHEYAQWREEVVRVIETYRDWCDRYDLGDTLSNKTLLSMLDALSSERITLAFAAEFSRGKTELINALFFAELGFRLLPAATEHTTMCPTELFYGDGCYIRLLGIETRLEDTSLIEYKENSANWKQIELDYESPEQLKEALNELLAVKKVSREHADELGLWDEVKASEQGLLDAEEVEIPCWRYALISLPHPLLKQGLCILDTPGLSVLGVEPELTLNILPSAEAIIFVLAADRGIMKSDVHVWRNYIHKIKGPVQLEPIVVMNKIDTLWDDLSGKAEYDLSVATQVDKSAEKLDLNKQLVFPVSAKQALVAKIKFDSDLLEKSRLASLEDHLSDNIVLHRSKMLKQAVIKGLVFLLGESLSSSGSKYKYALDQLEEFKKIDCDNAEMMDKLLAETRERQQVYLLNVENFQSSRQVFEVQAKSLVDSLAKDKVDAIIQNSKEELSKSLTTYRFKQNIKVLFDDLRDLLQDAVDTSNETRNLMKEIYKKFGVEYGFKDTDQQLFSMSEYQFQLECMLEEGELFRSSAKTTITQQAVVIKNLYGSIISGVRGVFKQAHHDASRWRRSVLLPLMYQIKDHKKQIDSRLQMLRKIKGSKEDVTENIAFLETRLVPLIQQYTELQTIVSALKIEDYTEH